MNVGRIAIGLVDRQVQYVNRIFAVNRCRLAVPAAVAIVSTTPVERCRVLADSLGEGILRQNSRMNIQRDMIDTIATTNRSERAVVCSCRRVSVLVYGKRQLARSDIVGLEELVTIVDSQVENTYRIATVNRRQLLTIDARVSIGVAVSRPNILLALRYNDRVVITLTYSEVQTQIDGVTTAERLDGIQQHLLSYRAVVVGRSVEDDRLAVANSQVSGLLLGNDLPDNYPIDGVTTVRCDTGFAGLIRTGLGDGLSAPREYFVRTERVLLLSSSVLRPNGQIEFVNLVATALAEQRVELMRRCCQTLHEGDGVAAAILSHTPIITLAVADTCVGHNRHNGIYMESKNLLSSRAIVVSRCYVQLIFALHELRAERNSPFAAGIDVEFVGQRYNLCRTSKHLIAEERSTVALVRIVHLHLRYRLAVMLVVSRSTECEYRVLADEELGGLRLLTSSSLVDADDLQFVSLAGLERSRIKQVNVEHRRAVGQTGLITATQHGSRTLLTQLPMA